MRNGMTTENDEPDDEKTSMGASGVRVAIEVSCELEVVAKGTSARADLRQAVFEINGQLFVQKDLGIGARGTWVDGVDYDTSGESDQDVSTATMNVKVLVQINQSDRGTLI